MENRFGPRVTRQEMALAQRRGFESCLAPQAGRTGALEGEGIAGVKATSD